MDEVENGEIAANPINLLPDNYTSIEIFRWEETGYTGKIGDFVRIYPNGGYVCLDNSISKRLYTPALEAALNLIGGEDFKDTGWVRYEFTRAEFEALIGEEVS